MSKAVDILLERVRDPELRDVLEKLYRHLNVRLLGLKHDVRLVERRVAKLEQLHREERLVVRPWYGDLEK